MFNKDNEIINKHTGKKVGKLRNIIDADGIGLVKIEDIDNKNMVLLDNNKKEHKITFSIPKYWTIDGILKEQLKCFN